MSRKRQKKKAMLEIVNRRVLETSKYGQFVKMDLKLNRPIRPAKHGTIILKGRLK